MLTFGLVLTIILAMVSILSVPLRGSEKVALLSKADYAYFSTFEWSLSENGYAVRYAYVADGSPKGRLAPIYMHRAIMQSPPGDVVVDHINRDRLDNRRENLRLVSKAVNNINRNVKTGGRFIGICLDRERSKKPWIAQIQKGGTARRIGRYATEEEAAWAYDTVAREIHGLCHLNFPDRGPMPGVKIPDMTRVKGRKYCPYPGVTFNKEPGLRKPWTAFYWDRAQKKTKHLGQFATPEDAAAIARSYRENQPTPTPTPS